ncbi:IL36G isoform 1, partial [Pongo abelii]
MRGTPGDSAGGGKAVYQSMYKPITGTINDLNQQVWTLQ